MAANGISWSGVVLRIVLALVLVLATFNPSGWSFYHWITAPPTGITAVKAFASLLLLIGWLVCLRTAYVALGLLGAVLLGALLATVVWMLIDYHVIEAAGRSAMVWMGLVIAGIVLGTGLSWSLIRARATGQVEVD
jgi:Family of unknown function (DUF6524)